MTPGRSAERLGSSQARSLRTPEARSDFERKREEGPSIRWPLFTFTLYGTTLELPGQALPLHLALTLGGPTPHDTTNS